MGFRKQNKKKAIPAKENRIVALSEHIYRMTKFVPVKFNSGRTDAIYFLPVSMLPFLLRITF